MKTFNNQAAQGDIFIRRIESLPVDTLRISPSDGVYIVAHSETGHNHVIQEAGNVTMYSTGDPMISYLQVLESCDAVDAILEHLRSFDTHESISVPKGVYEIRRQREYVPSGWRRVED